MSIADILINLKKKYNFIDIDIEQIFMELFNNQEVSSVHVVKEKIETYINNFILDSLNKNYNIIDKYIAINYKNLNTPQEKMISLVNILNIVRDSNYKNIENIINYICESSYIKKDLYKIFAKKESYALLVEPLNCDLLEDFYTVFCNENNLNFYDYEDDDKVTEDALKMYLRNISKKRLLTKEEQIELGFLIKKGDKQAKEKLVEHNLRLVVHIAKRFNKSTDIELIDLIGFGNIGLLKAVERYDPTKGFKFSTYAPWWIKQSISKGIMDYSTTIRKPIYIWQLMEKSKKYINEYLNINGEEPTDEMVAEHLSISLDEYKVVKDSFEKLASLDTPIGEEHDITLKEFITDDYSFEAEVDLNDFRVQIRRYIEVSNLTDDEKKIIYYRYGFFGKCYTLDEIAVVINLTKQRVGQLEKRALKKIKQSIVNSQIKEDITTKYYDDSYDFSIEELEEHSTLLKFFTSRGYKRPDINVAIKALNEDERKILAIKFGSKFNSNYKVSEEELDEVKKVIIKLFCILDSYQISRNMRK